MSTIELKLSNGDIVEFTRINNDVNGNPRYVCHFSNIETGLNYSYSIDQRYNAALAKAKKFGGRKFHNKQYGGGIVFQSYNLNELRPLFETL